MLFKLRFYFKLRSEGYIWKFKSFEDIEKFVSNETNDL